MGSTDLLQAIERKNIAIPSGSKELLGELAYAEDSKGVVLFAHGSGSSRFSSRNKFVAHQIESHGIATLLFDLLTEREEQIDEVTRSLRFDIDLLAERL